MKATTFYHIVDLLLQKNAQAPTLQFNFRVSIFKIRLIFFRASLYAHFTKAFQHLTVTDNTSPQLTIFICDHFSSITPLKLPTHIDLKIQTRGEILGLSDEHIMTSYNHHDGSLNIVNLTKNTAIYWIRGARYVPWWTAGSPLQRIIACWMRYHHHELTHAAAVGNQTHGVILAGKSGAGKSTTALACMMAGLRYLSEDYCLIQQKTIPIVHNVYNSLKLEEKTLQFFPQLRPWITNKNKQHHEKALLFQTPEFSSQLASSLPLKAIFVLEQTSIKHTDYISCSKAEALLALSASTLLQLSWSYQPTLKFYAQLLKQLPCYKLRLSSNLNEVSQCITQFIEG